MKKAFVTGAPGFLGAAITRELVQRGVEVRALALPQERLDLIEDLDVDIVRGDVRDPEAMAEFTKGVDTVFHPAAIYDPGHAIQDRMYEVNLRGTFHVLSAAKKNRVKKVIYTASIVSLGRAEPGKLADEDTLYNAWDIDFPYSRSKLFSRWIAEDFNRWNLDVRVVCPGIVLGPGDIRPTPSGRLILAVAGERVPGYSMGGGATYVDVRDAALAHVLAAERGQRGRTYVATAHNLSMREFMERVARVAKARDWFLRFPKPVVQAYVSGLEWYAEQTGTEPDVTRNFLDYSSPPSYFDNRRSREELGMTYRPLEETVADALAWFNERGMR